MLSTYVFQGQGDITCESMCLSFSEASKNQQIDLYTYIFKLFKLNGKKAYLRFEKLRFLTAKGRGLSIQFNGAMFDSPSVRSDLLFSSVFDRDACLHLHIHILLVKKYFSPIYLHEDATLQKFKYIFNQRKKVN